MDKVLRYLAIANMIEGCIVVLLQLAMLVTLHNWVDWICIGFWGGGLMILCGMWTLQRSQKKMITTAALSIFSGLCMVGFYSWNVSIVNCENVIDINEREKNKTVNWETDSDLCQWRLASDILFIIFGCVTIGINMFLAARASTMKGDSHASHHHAAPAPQHHQMQPVQHTVYVAPPSYPPPSQGYPQQHAYPAQQPYNPSYPSGPYKD